MSADKSPLASQLPPISSIPDMFRDIVARLPELTAFAKKIEGRPLRVATMCSGTESPLLALGLISRFLKEDQRVNLQIEHVFSCEIEPFKQAYIERNFNPPILFRDVCELGEEYATTAYGAKAEVPGNVDVLIAGTSCVDYSTLNNSQQDIDANGESGRTFRGMLSWVARHRPSIVLLENVCGAPWDRVVEKFEKVDYSAKHIRLDTKNYYIPHTRSRGYLVAINGLRHSQWPVQWEKKVIQMSRPTSSTLDAFLLATDDPRIHIARKKLVHEALAYERKTGYDWGKCESRHQKARHEEQLGNRRPLTGWEEGGTAKMPTFCWNDWCAAQVDRVWDLMDVTTLRAAALGKDPLYKTEVWNLSQNVDRQIGSSRIGIAPCLTPTMIPYITNRGGPMVGMEALGLQGLPVDELLLTRETEDQLADLAGNAMSSTVVGTAVAVALVVAEKLFPATSQNNDDAMEVDGVPQPKATHDNGNVDDDNAIEGDDELSQTTLDLGDSKIESLPVLLSNALASIRICECEGRDDVVARPVLRCVDCGGTACIKCAGRPEHNYVPIDIEKEPRSRPADFRRVLREQLPMSVTIHGVSMDLLEKTQAGLSSEVTKVSETLWVAYKEAVSSILSADLMFREDKRQETWTVVYESSHALLEVHLHHIRSQLLLYAKASPSIPANSPIREMLMHPVARLVCNGGLLSGEWELAIPVSHSVEITVEGKGELVPAWEAKLGLEISHLKNKKVWSSVFIDVDESSQHLLDQKIMGVFRLIDKCGTANSALHVMENRESGMLPLYLFLDPTRCGLPDDDCFVMSSNIRRVEYGERRLIVGSLDKSWRPGSENGPQRVSFSLPVMWVAAPSISLKSTEKLFATYSVPSAPLSVSGSLHACSKAKAIVVCKVPLHLQEKERTVDVWPRDRWVVVDSIHQRPTFRALTWLTERIRSIEHLNHWLPIELDGDDTHCNRCAPSPPELRWAKRNRNVIAIEDPLQAGKYEQSLKKRPSPFVTQLRYDTSESIGTLRLGINVPSLTHRALSRLPTVDRLNKPLLSWRLTTSYTPPATLSPPKFTLKSNKQDPPAKQPPNFKLQLRPEQLRSLTWMLRQESTDVEPFLEEEISEAILHPLGWRVEGKAVRPIQMSGGVLADEVGYGKTAITLGLIDTSFGNAPKPRKGLSSHGKIRTKANLIVVPAQLTRQWASEVQKFLGKNRSVHILESMSHLNSLTIQDVLDVDILIVAGSLMKSEIYLANLQAFAAGGNLPHREGRYFDAKLRQVHSSLQKQIARLTKEGSSSVLDAIREAEENPETDETAMTADSKRLKGKQYRKQPRDKMHGDTVPTPRKSSSAATSSQSRQRLLPEVLITTTPRTAFLNNAEEGVPVKTSKRRRRTVIVSDEDEAPVDDGDFIVISSDSEELSADNEDEDRKFTKAKQIKRIKSRASNLTTGKSAKRKSNVLSDSEALGHGHERSNSPPPKKQKSAESKAPLKPKKAPPAKKEKPKELKHMVDPWKLKSNAVRQDYTEMRCPPLELFHFNRLVIDEFTYVEGKIYPLITSLKSDHRWILSGTPPTREFATVKTIANFMGVHLGIDDDFWEGQTKESLREAKKRQKEQTNAESFHSFREIHSLDWHAHRNDVAQAFLDRFVRQNIAEIDEIPFEDMMRPVTLPAAERAIYLELEHHLRALDMMIRRGKKTESDREKRMAESLGNSATAEEALLKRCSHFELDADRANALKACEVIVEERTRQLNECIGELETEIGEALRTQSEIGPVDYQSHLQQWLRMTHTPGGVGDADAKRQLHDVQSSGGFNYEESLAMSQKKGPDLDRESPKTKEARWAHREHAHFLKKLEKELVGRVRSLRYFTVVRDLQRKTDHNKHSKCPSCEKTDLPISNIAILSSCGHTGCHTCVMNSAQNEECVSRAATGCNAPARVLNVVKAETLGEDEHRSADVKHFGKKLEKIVFLIKDIPKDERVLLFVQFPDLMKKVGEALTEGGISFLEIKGSPTARSKNLMAFQNPDAKEKVLLLNVGDESAAGANLTVANHVIFISPLLTSSQQFYDATDTQAIGRLRRYGQQKKVHIYRFLTLDSIDVELFEARDGRKVIRE
ncbi:uncharacterized protein EI90DRAFT_3279585 [Cantharellus anzutake]|uniref:uncharacterized protein n=1 Tax=Cantharellus anzutake TaxID=1750568 RepID=UPI00190742D8|nr:uncharacterized protein EI90DRAFT_3279585 [Cantharellus anzutake]KAF8338028.1 hypothetical protein EI90DRAFT_3279585 [Cantharellus anzutake]